MSRWAYISCAFLLPIGALVLVGYLLSLRPDSPSIIALKHAQFAPSATDSVSIFANGRDVTLPHDMRSEAGVTEPIAWYLIDIELPAQPDRLWALYVPGVEMTAAVYVNDVLVGGRSELSDPLPRLWNRPLMITLPRSTLSSGRNELKIRVAARAPWGRLSDLYVGPYDDLRPHYEARWFWRVTFLILTMVGSGVLAVFMVILGFARNDASYKWFGAFAAVWCLNNGFFATVDVPVPNTLWDLYAYMILGLLLYTGSMFSFRFLGLQQCRWEQILRHIGIAGMALLVPSMFLLPATFNFLGSIIWNGLLLVMGAYPAALLMRRLLGEQQIGHFLLAVCYLFTLLTGLYDWLMISGLGYRHHGMLMFYSAAPTLATMSIILLQRFVSALRESAALYREMEQRVDRKAQEIKAAFVKNQKLEAAQLLSQERERIMRDMHDGVGSLLIGTLSFLDRQHPRESIVAEELSTALADLRLMIDSLDDVDNDLATTLGLFRNRIQPQLDAAGLQLDWQVNDLPPLRDLGPQRVLHFMRILQEITTNTLKHARASRLTIQTTTAIKVNGMQYMGVAIRDDGCGFTVGGADPGRGLDNISMRARAASLTLCCSSDERGTQYQIGFCQIG